MTIRVENWRLPPPRYAIDASTSNHLPWSSRESKSIRLDHTHHAKSLRTPGEYDSCEIATLARKDTKHPFTEPNRSVPAGHDCWNSARILHVEDEVNVTIIILSSRLALSRRNMTTNPEPIPTKLNNTWKRVNVDIVIPQTMTRSLSG